MMGEYERKTFRWFWGAWSWALLGGIFVFGSLWYDRAIWVAWAIVELWGAFRRTDDDTLSEFAQWLAGWRKPGASKWKSWGVLAPGLLGACVWHSGYVVSFGYTGVESMQRLTVHGFTIATYGPNVLAGMFTSSVVFGFLFWHFLREDEAW